MPLLRLGVGREASEVSPTALVLGLEKKEGTCETFESLLCCCFLCLAYTLDIHIIYTLRYMYITRTSDLRFLSWSGKTFNAHTHSIPRNCVCVFPRWRSCK